MVGKGQILKPSSVRRLGARVLLGPLLDKQPADLKLKAHNQKLVENLRDVQELIVNLGGKLYAIETVHLDRVKQASLGGGAGGGDKKDKSEKDEVKTLLRTTSSHMGGDGRGRGEVDDAAEILTDADVMMIENVLPLKLERVMNRGQVAAEYEGIKRKILAEQKRRSKSMHNRTWSSLDEGKYEATIRPLYYEYYVLQAVLVLAKEDIDVRLACLQKYVKTMDGKASLMQRMIGESKESVLQEHFSADKDAMFS